MKRLLTRLIALTSFLLVSSLVPGIGAAAEANSAPADEATASEAPAAEQVRQRRSSRPRRATHVRSRQHRTTHVRSRSHRQSYPRHYVRTHRVPHYYTPPIVYTPPPHVVYSPPHVVYSPRQVVVQEPIYVEQQPVVVQEQVAHAQPAPVVYEEAPPEPVDEEFGASATFHFTAMSVGDTDLAFETVQGAELLGAGGAIRFDLDSNWMLEVGLDVLVAEENGIEQISAPITLSAIAHLFPDSVFDPYALAGLGIVLTEYDDPAYSEVEQYSQFMGHLGGGVEINLGNILITSDIRFLMLQARPDRNSVVDGFGNTESVSSAVTVRGEEPTTTAASNPTSGYADADAMNTGLQFMVGAGWRF